MILILEQKYFIIVSSAMLWLESYMDKIQKYSELYIYIYIYIEIMLSWEYSVNALISWYKYIGKRNKG